MIYIANRARIGNATNLRGCPRLYGTIDRNATWDQLIPIVDDDDARVDLADYEFEIVLRRCDSAVLTLSTVTGELVRSTDDDGDVLHILAAPTIFSGLCGDYHCSFAAKDDSDQVWLIGSGTVTVRDDPAAFS